jgi:hypothetical protein
MATVTLEMGPDDLPSLSDSVTGTANERGKSLFFLTSP